MPVFRTIFFLLSVCNSLKKKERKITNFTKLFVFRLAMKTLSQVVCVMIVLVCVTLNMTNAQGEMTSMCSEYQSLC